MNDVQALHQMAHHMRVVGAHKEADRLQERADVVAFLLENDQQELADAILVGAHLPQRRRR